MHRVLEPALVRWFQQAALASSATARRVHLALASHLARASSSSSGPGELAPGACSFASAQSPAFSARDGAVGGLLGALLRLLDGCARHALAGWAQGPGFGGAQLGGGNEVLRGAAAVLVAWVREWPQQVRRRT